MDIEWYWIYWCLSGVHRVLLIVHYIDIGGLMNVPDFFSAAKLGWLAAWGVTQHPVANDGDASKTLASAAMMSGLDLERIVGNRANVSCCKVSYISYEFVQI